MSQQPDDIRAIEARHTQDDVWFRAGHHDPNGYVAMAHKDRGALLKIALGEPSDVSCETHVIILCPKCAYGIGLTHSLQCAALDQPGDPGFEPSRTHITIPKAAWDWLMGEAVDDAGNYFGGGNRLPTPHEMRTTFRRMCGL